MENFTWDWIYEPYHSRHRRLERFSQYLGALYDSVEIRIQAEPCCHPQPGSLKTKPVCRALTSERSHVRASLGVSSSEPLVLVSMGGLAKPSHFQCALPGDKNVIFVIPGGSQRLQRRENVILLPFNPAQTHPDLVNAAGAVIGKVEYSTLAEVHQVGVPFGFLARSDFRESAVLAEFIEGHIPSVALDMEKYLAGSWGKDLETLLSLPREARNPVRGARHLKNYL